MCRGICQGLCRVFDWDLSGVYRGSVGGLSGSVENLSGGYRGSVGDLSRDLSADLPGV